MSNAKEIWETLSKIDVSKHIEKKGNLSYLSWAWAWGVLMEKFPQCKYVFFPEHKHDDGSVTVSCELSIDECSRVMWLPVMDHKNNAVKEPDARKISDAKMRCLVKCIAMFGLGHYIYAGEDLPPSDPVDEFAHLKELMDLCDGFNFVFALKELDEEAQIRFFNSFEKGQITKKKQFARDLEMGGLAQADELADRLSQFAENEDQDSIRSEMQGLNKPAMQYLASKWNEQTKKFIKEALKNGARNQ